MPQFYVIKQKKKSKYKTLFSFKMLVDPYHAKDFAWRIGNPLNPMID